MLLGSEAEIGTEDRCLLFLCLLHSVVVDWALGVGLHAFAGERQVKAANLRPGTLPRDQHLQAQGQVYQSVKTALLDVAAGYVAELQAGE
jgi:hypothetical protein